MATQPLVFSLCLLSLFLLRASTAEIQLPQHRLRAKSSCQIQQLNAREPTRRFDYEAGSTELWDSTNQDFECAGVDFVRHTIRPKGLLLPHYTNSPQLVYIIQGSGIQGNVIPGCAETYESGSESSSERRRGEGKRSDPDRHQKLRRFRQGDILALQSGVTHWTYNDGDTPIISVAIRDVANEANQLDSNFRDFFLAGKPQPSQGRQEERFGRGSMGRARRGEEQQDKRNILSGFETEFLAEAFNNDPAMIRKIQGREGREDNRGAIVHAERLSLVFPEYSQQEQEREREQEQEREARQEQEQEQGRPGQQEQEREARQEQEREARKEREQEQGRPSQQEQEREREARQGQEKEREARQEQEQEREQGQPGRQEQEHEQEREARQEQEREAQKEREQEQGRPSQQEREQEREARQEQEKEREARQEREQEQGRPSQQEREREARQEQEGEQEREARQEKERETRREQETEQEREARQEQEREQEQGRPGQQEQERKAGHEIEPDMDPESNGLEETLCSFRIRENIDNPRKADVFNPKAGRITRLNSQKLPILNSLRLNADRGVLYKNAMMAPHWSMNAHTLIYVIRGSARIQVVGNQGNTVFDNEAREGQLLVVPQNFAIVKRATDQGFEWVSFRTNDNAMIEQLAGRLSAVRAMPVEVVMNAYGVSREEARSLKYNREETTLLSAVSRSA